MSIDKANSFSAQQVSDMAKHINSGTTTSILGIPGAGITLFMKHLSAQPLGTMVYLDVFSLPSFKADEFYKALLEKLGGIVPPQSSLNELVALCKKRLELLTAGDAKVVICIAGFDQLQPEFSASFFHYLRTLRGINPDKIVFVFGICRRLDTLIPEGLVDADLSLFSTVYYLRPYSLDDLDHLLKTYGPHTDLSLNEVNRIKDLSGGHFQFLQLLLGSERRNDPVRDPFIQLAFKNIFTYLSTTQKAIVRKLAIDGSYSKTDEYLTKLGIIKQTSEGFELFSPLFSECVRILSAPKLPVKERRLLAVLKRNEGKLVTKREIFDAVWRNDEIGSEWALNALIYRLRKHPAFTSQNYTIESNKKLGYTLIKDD